MQPNIDFIIKRFETAFEKYEREAFKHGKRAMIEKKSLRWTDLINFDHAQPSVGGRKKGLKSMMSFDLDSSIPEEPLSAFSLHKYKSLIVPPSNPIRQPTMGPVKRSGTLALDRNAHNGKGAAPKLARQSTVIRQGNQAQNEATTKSKARGSRFKAISQLSNAENASSRT